MVIEMNILYLYFKQAAVSDLQIQSTKDLTVSFISVSV